MADREKVIDELVKHIEIALSVDSDYVDCVRTDLLQTAVALLKEQEPRVLTPSELQEPRVLTPSELQPDCLVWIEVPQSDEIWPALLQKTDWFGPPTWAMRGYALAGYYLHDEYGRDWRCWSAKPTDEQREATPWID